MSQVAAVRRCVLEPSGAFYVLSVQQSPLGTIFRGNLRAEPSALLEALETSAASYPTAADQLRLQAHDRAWEAYRLQLRTQLAEDARHGQSRGWPRVPHRALPIGDSLGLPAFDAHRNRLPQTPRARQLTPAQMFPWADDHLNKKVLPDLDNLCFPPEEPPPFDGE